MKKYIIITLCAAITLIAFGTVFVNVRNVEAQNAVNGIVTSDESSATEADMIAETFIRQFEIISSVKLDTSIFESPVFRSLEDFSKPIPEEQRGRANPFAPY